MGDVLAVILEANGLGLHHRGRWVFRDLDLTVQSGQLVALTGPPGSGRTSALLALTGHFKHTHGTVGTPGKAALGLVRGVHEPEPMLTAHEHLDERLRLLGRHALRRHSGLHPGDEPDGPRPGDEPGGPRSHRRREPRGRAAGRRVVAAALQRLPFDAGTLGRDLSPLDRHLLMVETAALSRPDLIAVDDIDVRLTHGERLTLIEALRRDGRAAIVTARSLPPGLSPSAHWELTK